MEQTEQKHSPGRGVKGIREAFEAFDSLEPTNHLALEIMRGVVHERLDAAQKVEAAAPELLEALQAVVRVADRNTVEFDMARAAIAKATSPTE
ncbi:MAG: hypothetical protein QM754_18610 [Tepidisphaeraceae bacterium]